MKPTKLFSTLALLAPAWVMSTGDPNASKDAAAPNLHDDVKLRRHPNLRGGGTAEFNSWKPHSLVSRLPKHSLTRKLSSCEGGTMWNNSLVKYGGTFPNYNNFRVAGYFEISEPKRLDGYKVLSNEKVWTPKCLVYLFDPGPSILAEIYEYIGESPAGPLVASYNSTAYTRTDMGTFPTSNCFNTFLYEVSEVDITLKPGQYWFSYWFPHSIGLSSLWPCSGPHGEYADPDSRALYGYNGASSSWKPYLRFPLAFRLEFCDAHTPVANDDAYTAVEGTTLSVSALDGVLANDVEIDGNFLTVDLSSVAGPSHGTVVMNADGSFMYTPTGGYCGSDSMTYTASDGQLDSNVATVGITVVDESAPRITCPRETIEYTVAGMGQCEDGLPDVQAQVTDNCDGSWTDPVPGTMVGGPGEYTFEFTAIDHTGNSAAVPCTLTFVEDDGDGVCGTDDLCPGTEIGAVVDPSGCSDAQVDQDGNGICDEDAPSGGPTDCMLVGEIEQMINHTVEKIEALPEGYFNNPEQQQKLLEMISDAELHYQNGDTEKAWKLLQKALKRVDGARRRLIPSESLTDDWINDVEIRQRVYDMIMAIINEMMPPGDDEDGDEVPNASDNCKFDYNPSQDDADADGVGDACDECKETQPNTPVNMDGCSMCPAVVPGVTFSPAAPLEGEEVQLSHNHTLVSVDWGDGTMDQSLNHMYMDQGSYDVQVTVHHNVWRGCEASETQTLEVANVAPTVDSVVGPSDPRAVGTIVDLDVHVSDAGLDDTHTVDVDWSDGNISSDHSPPYALSHAYTLPGVYGVSVTAADDDGGVSMPYEYMVVIYDPSAGFVTGGGWFNSDPGAYLSDPTLGGKVNFGFVSKYHKNTEVPKGNTKFQIKVADLNFHSSSYDWLVVTSSNYAEFKGSGTINRLVAPTGDEYKFQVWAGDDQPDTFRIKIWYEGVAGVENVVYDNGFDQEIAGGSIKIHKK